MSEHYFRKESFHVLNDFLIYFPPFSWGPDLKERNNGFISMLSCFSTWDFRPNGFALSSIPDVKI